MNHFEALGRYPETREAVEAARYRRTALLNDLGQMALRARDYPEQPFNFAEARALLEGAERCDTERVELEAKPREAAMPEGELQSAIQSSLAQLEAFFKARPRATQEP